MSTEHYIISLMLNMSRKTSRPIHLTSLSEISQCTTVCAFKHHTFSNCRHLFHTSNKILTNIKHNEAYIAEYFENKLINYGTSYKHRHLNY